MTRGVPTSLSPIHFLSAAESKEKSFQEAMWYKHASILKKYPNIFTHTHVYIYIPCLAHPKLPRLVSSMEKKMQAAQEAFDTFEDVRSRLGDTKRTAESLGFFVNPYWDMFFSQR